MSMPVAAGRVHLKKENWVAKGTALISKGRHVVLQSGSLQIVTCLCLVCMPLACFRCPSECSLHQTDGSVLSIQAYEQALSLSACATL